MYHCVLWGSMVISTSNESYILVLDTLAVIRNATHVGFHRIFVQVQPVFQRQDGIRIDTLVGGLFLATRKKEE